jgi:integrase/recombinase XerD
MKILFWLVKYRLDKASGKAPISCRITVSGERKEIWTEYSIELSRWNNGSVKGNKEDARIINDGISFIENKLRKIYNRLEEEGKEITADTIKDLYSGKSGKKWGLLEVFRIWLEREYSRIGLQDGLTKSTLKTYDTRYDNLQAFIVKQYGKSDVPLKGLGSEFVERLKDYLQTKEKEIKSTKEIIKGVKLEHIAKHLNAINKVYEFAISRGYVDKNYLQGQKISGAGSSAKEIVYLDEDELTALENYTFASHTLQKVADMFVFSCHTGLAYEELSNLTEDHIVKGIDGKLWINMDRTKTTRYGRKINVPLLPKAQEILNKYKDDLHCQRIGKLLPIMSNQKYNEYIKEAANVLNINKKLSTHHGRKTFGMVLLNNDVPLETVSKLLGHSSVKVTEKHYVRILDKKVARDVDKFLNRKQEESDENKKAGS